MRFALLGALVLIVALLSGCISGPPTEQFSFTSDSLEETNGGSSSIVCEDGTIVKIGEQCLNAQDNFYEIEDDYHVDFVEYEGFVKNTENGSLEIMNRCVEEIMPKIEAHKKIIIKYGLAYTDYSDTTIRLRNIIENICNEYINWINPDVNISVLEEKITFLKDNSKLPDKGVMVDILKQNMLKKCIKLENDTCAIKAACPPWLNDTVGVLHYRDDVEFFRGDWWLTDTTSSLEEFIVNKGGDCEDFALFYKAEINYFLENCSDLNKVTIESWVYAPYYANYDLSFDRYSVYYEHAKAISWSDYIYPAVVCYSIDENIGHCILAFTKNKIKNIEDIYPELSGAPLLEPIDGFYIGKINEKSSSIYINNLENDSESEQQIFEIMTDDDGYSFDTTRQINWTSYTIEKEDFS
ncbi:MAG: hypothetical protein WC634_02860 [archaeon]